MEFVYTAGTKLAPGHQHKQLRNSKVDVLVPVLTSCGRSALSSPETNIVGYKYLSEPRQCLETIKMDRKQTP
jgi:hypothetical protein